MRVKFESKFKPSHICLNFKIQRIVCDQSNAKFELYILPPACFKFASDQI
ncbi:hypothetical protein CAMRE0001_0061 [Campylobacter rectus RM3267]|uniref:Uncharacterized protein n=1 Tax=Campylobacter rectus RM3267 TaxID=553218 RepID=B9D3K7_CAMRE|nr:hypothetical protein CAMRE0001_0061 [Campylobacter rectus RM3267]